MLVTQTAFGYIGLGVLAIAIMMGIFTGLNGFLMSSSRLLFLWDVQVLCQQCLVNYIVNTKHHMSQSYSLSRCVVNCTLAGKNCIDLDCRYVIYRVYPWLPTLLHVCLQRNYSVITNKSNTYAPVYKTFAIIGSFVSFIFLALLLVPGSPAALTAPSYIALLGWLIIGLIFFVIRYPRIEKYG